MDGKEGVVVIGPCCHNNNNNYYLWNLPDTVLFQILSYVAPRTHRSAVICHQLAPLSKDATKSLLLNEKDKNRDDDADSSTTTAASIWDIILRQDYGVREHDQHSASTTPRGGKAMTTTRRACKRLRRSLLQRVKSAHQLTHDNTEIAFFYLSEMINAGSAKGKKLLTKAKLRGLLDEYGPIRVNRVVSSGGLFLVETCRARHVKESTILQCVTELVEQHGALVDGCTNESASVRQNALTVAAARGMPTVVKYLLVRGANPNQTASGRFRLQASPKRSVQQKEVTPLEFAQAMYETEIEAGAKDQELSALKSCIKQLQRVTQKRPPMAAVPAAVAIAEPSASRRLKKKG